MGIPFGSVNSLPKVETEEQYNKRMKREAELEEEAARRKDFYDLSSRIDSLEAAIDNIKAHLRIK
jgi:polyhydroxyalkanoate synthesis regulator phasin